LLNCTYLFRRDTMGAGRDDGRSLGCGRHHYSYERGRHEERKMSEIIVDSARRMVIIIGVGLRDLSRLDTGPPIVGQAGRGAPQADPGGLMLSRGVVRRSWTAQKQFCNPSPPV
jgi:hypothetical protein